MNAEDRQRILAFLETVHPYDALTQDELARVAGCFGRRHYPAGATIYRLGEPLEGIYLINSGGVEVLDPQGATVSLLAARNSFGERGMMRDGLAMTTARASEASDILLLPAAEFRRLIGASPAFERFFARGRPAEPRGPDLATSKLGELMVPAPLTCGPDTPVAAAAAAMKAARVSCLCVTEGDRLLGILTTRDLAHRVLAEGRSPDTPAVQVMTPDPVSLPPEALGSDLLHLMLERGIGHVPVVAAGRLVGIVTQTDLTRFQAVTSTALILEVASADTVAKMTAVTARIPQLLVQLIGGHQAHEVATRLITDIADAVTRRLLTLAEAELGPPPAAYLWAACGSQGRQEQSGTSDQDNCLIIDDAAPPQADAYFEALAKRVTDGLHACGYVYCPGEMMASTSRWRQRLSLWRDYFRRWIAVPNPEAQMLASVMFDLRPIGGETSLFGDLQAETLAAAGRNSIFVAHMVANSLKHAPPLGLLRGLATIRSGEHRNEIDLKHGGVVPVADLGRVYALIGGFAAVNTRARLQAAAGAGVISASGARDLTEAYDLIATLRLENQVRQVRMGEKPGNHLAPAELSDFERSHLRDAFVVVRTMQSALAHGRGAPG